MDQGPYLIDTNVFVIDLRYPRDRHFGVNRRFLDAIKRERSGITTTINLLELCGILSFNLNQRQLITLWEQFPDRFGVEVLPTAEFDAPVPKMGVGELFALLQQRMSLGDGQFLLTARNHAAFVTTLVTWDRDHFLDRFAGRVATPEEILA
ncbi:MAG: PIN domain-containing protein [Spirochaetaceae bacterium]|nr:PIN domain-containing protein [Spirochaetaceae bacterium]